MSGEEQEDSKPKLNLVISHSVLRTGKRFGKDPGSLRFVYDGERLSPTETPAERSMEDGDVIDALFATGIDIGKDRTQPQGCTGLFTPSNADVI
ncbi:hypothetical protein BGY98DRAFT_604042 [Russula aff. rugulosa BPL654]|nr:hypothetical protein BGY98DRAFT_604042 [Russula aff. rugulosa BPL654]